MQKLVLSNNLVLQPNSIYILRKSLGYYALYSQIQNSEHILVVNSLLCNFYLKLPKSTTALHTKDHLVLICKANDSTKSFSNTIENFLLGGVKGYFRRLHLKGLGFRTQVKKRRLICKLGYSHLKILKLPLGLKVKRIKKQKLKIMSVNFSLLIRICELIRDFRPINLYKIKGILYRNETYKLKPGKKRKR
jgi:ribosomal protein L6P/L9E